MKMSLKLLLESLHILVCHGEERKKIKKDKSDIVIFKCGSSLILRGEIFQLPKSERAFFPLPQRSKRTSKREHQR